MGCIYICIWYVCACIYIGVCVVICKSILSWDVPLRTRVLDVVSHACGLVLRRCLTRLWPSASGTSADRGREP